MWNSQIPILQLAAQLAARSSQHNRVSTRQRRVKLKSAVELLINTFLRTGLLPCLAMSRPGQQRGQQTAIVVGSADRFGALVVSTGKDFVKKHPVISVSWVVGLLVSILASGYTPAPEAVLNYEVRQRAACSFLSLCGRLQWVGC